MARSVRDDAHVLVLNLHLVDQKIIGSSTESQVVVCMHRIGIS